ncbi:tRNA-dihydrouridine(20) synthase (NAD(+)) [Saccharomycopsis crataegensis]|uniref:tRNA-dihydrouridine synthase n=1 Tax=Saccharomycopsis crataegensis TaxID=43959 RepID=A0AAV5QN56_9ASCO|nr:tRNA-dihydrouridine(20) synthase (NAD(+)) [Saccharomycopsis crataegensis]
MSNMGVNYTGKFVLAPMVRIGELPTRLLALKAGADLVWGPEIIDRKIITFQRTENEKLRTIDFLTAKGKTKKDPSGSTVSFRTHRPSEQGKLIFQMGTANPDLAVKAANIIIDDIDGLDINAGCPKHFSVHAGMGAALLKTPDLLCEILTRLVNEVGKPKNKPISVKIRILESKESTLELVDRILKTGVANLTVHCRTRDMRNRESPIRDYLPFIIEKCRNAKVSFIINGGIKSHQEYLDLQKEYGSDIGSMIAEAAETNPTVFSPIPYHWAKAAKEFAKYATEFDNHYANTKYCLSRSVPGKAKVYQHITKSKSKEEIAQIMDKLGEDGSIEGITSEKLNSAKAKPNGAEAKTNNNKRDLEDPQPNNGTIAKKAKVDQVA